MTNLEKNCDQNAKKEKSDNVTFANCEIKTTAGQNLAAWKKLFPGQTPHLRSVSSVYLVLIFQKIKLVIWLGYPKTMW